MQLAEAGGRIAPSGAIEATAKGGLAAPLFFGALALACAGSRFGHVTLWVLSALALLAAGWAGSARSSGASRVLAAATFGFSAWVALHTLLLSAAYTPAGLYHPLLLAGAFAVFRRLDDATERRMAFAALAAGAILGLWGLVQVAVQGQARAQALFEAPATLAALVNLLLVPILVFVLAGRRGTATFALGLLLAAALFAAGSRGGLIGLAAGLAAAAALAMRGGNLRGRGLAAVVGLLAVAWVLVAGLRALPLGTSERAEPPDAAAQAESSLSRLELYALSARAWQEHPIAGTGYLTFRHVLERGRASVPSYGATNETWFVHNDYLQALQELGPLGLAGLLAVAWLPLLIAYRREPALAPGDGLPALAAASALTATACHALVDFPFHVPAILLLYGALLGSFVRHVQRGAVAVAVPPHPSRLWLAVRAVALALAGVLLLRPVFAELAAEWGLRRFADRQTQAAAFWLETARRVEPADWRYHWYAGQFWDDIVSATPSRDAAQLAHRAFAAGFAANPLEVRSLLGLISLHRRHPDLLDAPADRATRAAWVAQAEALAPFNAAVRAERKRLEAAK